MYTGSSSLKTSIKKNKPCVEGKFGSNRLSRHGVLTGASTIFTQRCWLKLVAPGWGFTNQQENKANPERWKAMESDMSHDHGLSVEWLGTKSCIALSGSLFSSAYKAEHDWTNRISEQKATQTKVDLTGQPRRINIKSQSYRLLSSFNFLISSSSVSKT